MGKFDGILLVSDFDDTLYDFTLSVPERNLEAIRYLIREGGRFTVATGRAHRTFAPFAHLVPMNAPAVLSNGAAVYDFQADKMLEQTCLPPSAPGDLEALLVSGGLSWGGHLCLPSQRNNPRPPKKGELQLYSVSGA